MSRGIHPPVRLGRGRRTRCTLETSLTLLSEFVDMEHLSTVDVMEIICTLTGSV